MAASGNASEVSEIEDEVVVEEAATSMEVVHLVDLELRRDGEALLETATELLPYDVKLTHTSLGAAIGGDHH